MFLNEEVSLEKCFFFCREKKLNSGFIGIFGIEGYQIQLSLSN